MTGGVIAGPFFVVIASEGVAIPLGGHEIASSPPDFVVA